MTEPFIWALILFFVSWRAKRASTKKFSFRWAIIILLFFSNTVIFSEFTRLWEEEGTKIEDVEHYDCAIVLGGMAEWDNGNERLSIRRGGDRIWQTINLYHLGKVDKILISGDDGYLIERGLNESAQMKKVLVENGIPEEDILIESVSKNTYQNAVESKKIIDQYPEIQSILLVTSALHMKRSKACFKKAGFQNFGTFTTDHYTSGKRGYAFDQYIIPDASTLRDWERLLHEWMGYVVYKIVGYI